MRRIREHQIVVMMLSLAVIIITLVGMPVYEVRGQESQPTPVPEEEAIYRAVTLAITRHRLNPAYDYYYELVGISYLGSWAYADVYLVDKSSDTPIASSGKIIIVHKVAGREWEAILPEEGSRFNALLDQVPDALLDRLTKDVVRASEQVEPGVVAARKSGYRLPWPSPYWAVVTQNYKRHGKGQIDFLILGTDDIVAAKDGTIVYINDSHSIRGCNPKYSRYNNVVVIKHADGEYTLYLHIQKNSVPRRLKDYYHRYGSVPIKRGQLIAKEGNVGYTCGRSGKHLHLSTASSFYIARYPDVYDEDGDRDRRELVETAWTRTHHEVDFDEYSYDELFDRSPKDKVQSQNGGTSAQPCPTSGGVILYKHAGYNCGGEGEGSGWVRRNNTGWQNVPGRFNDQASSVRIPPGWSVKLYEHSDRGGGWVCRSSDDDNFAGDWFNNGVPLNDHVSSFEVFTDSRCGELVNRPPNIPSPQSPGDWYVSRDGRAPTLCWNSSGDPDGDPLEFYVEIYDSAVNVNSGWLRQTCWRPSQLDGHYYGYQWRVKARDSHGAESSWSVTWHFNIEAPNKPPLIDFRTANGDSFPSGRINSRTRDWTFHGTASDPEGRLREVRFHCDDCDNPGNGPDITGGGNWSLTRTGMAGKNMVYFTASDDRHTVSSRRLDLRIDLAAPETRAELNGQRYGAWFNTPVQVRLQAADRGTGRALVHVREIRYRVDSGSWKTHSGASVAFTVSGDGPHTVEYYAVDHVGNQEPTRSVTFRIDTTPPTPPSDATETHGVVNDRWQKAVNIPTFTWQPGSDTTSGIAYTELYFGTDPNGIAVHKRFTPGEPQSWTPYPAGVRTSTYYLRARARDNAGNYSPWTILFTFRYDGTPPENPEEAAHAAGITNKTWQRTTNIADFTWPVPHDEGSGVKGYYLYWGTDPNGTGTTFTTDNQYQNPTPLCGINEACVGYLRLRSVDNVDNQAEKWSTAFELWYDNAPPTVDFTFKGGITRTTQTLVTLNITASDEGSGVREMRLSNNGKDWTPWEAFTAERVWEIPAISRQWWPVYLQVRDGVGLVSQVISHTIYLDVNPQQPRSASFRLFDYALSAGAGEHTSSPSGYRGHSTVGQVVDSARVNSLNYIITGGYEAGSQALPIVEPTHDEFTFINGVFASGTGADTMRSPLYEMWGSVGEMGLPNNKPALVSQNHQLQPGFLAAVPPSATPTPTPTPGPTPTPEPTPACEFPTITINNGAVFTNDLHVTLSICAPRAVEMMISNDGGFTGAQWEPYAETKAWTLTSYGQYVLPRFVYAAFKDQDGTVYGVYFDDIIYDPNPPQGEIAVGDNGPVILNRGAKAQRNRGAEVLTHGKVKYVRRLGDREFSHPVALLRTDANGAVDLYLNAWDDNSGVTEMQISATGSFTDTAWETYLALKPWTPPGGDGIKTAYARFRDRAGNPSRVVTTTFVLDTLAPFGGIALERSVVGPDVVTTTVYLGADDNLSGVAEMRISEDPTFSDAVWQPYTTTLTWPISYTVETEKTLYVQYRDLAGNVSEVYSHTYLIDTTPPEVYAEVAPGDTLTRTVRIYAYDELTSPEALRLSNDPLMTEGVVTLPYVDTVTWAFDEQRVVWVQVKDSVGNWSEPFPAWAPPACPGDLAGNDGVITEADLQRIVSLWREPAGYPLDIDGDNRVTILDILWYASRFGQGCP